ncbi:MAG: SsrA-binding protein SmpB [Planctomycetes bacterium]|nr:SsrA-binding protein SmpB [Planctomycetota bacterium]
MEKPDSGIKIIAKNKRAYFRYEILSKHEAGLVLVGTEVKSLREGAAAMSDAYAKPERGELWLFNLDISMYKNGGYRNHEPKRARKLLMHRGEIARLIGKTSERGLTLVPLALYFRGGYAKVELGLARGKKLHDKRAAIKERENAREMQRVNRGGR